MSTSTWYVSPLNSCHYRINKYKRLPIIPRSTFSFHRLSCCPEQRPAFADISSDLDIFFSGAPPPLKSLNHDEDGSPAESRCREVDHEPETLEQQVKQLQTQLPNIHEIDQFLQEVCGSEA